MYHPIFILYFALSLPPCSYNFAFLEQNSCKLDLSCFYNLLLKNPVCTQLFFSVIIYLLSQGTLTKVFVFLPVTAIYRTVFPAFYLGPVCSICVSSFGARPVTIFSGFMVAGGLMMSSFAPNIYFLYLSYGIVVGKKHLPFI